MPATEMVVVMTLAIAIVMIIALGFRALNLRSLHRTVTVAIEQGSPEVPTLIERLGRRPRVSLKLIAYVLLAITAAILGVGALEGNLHDLKEAVAPAMFPGFVGAALLLYLRSRDRAPDGMGDA